MATQKALWLPKVGAEYTLGENEIPEPGPEDVLVKLEAIALNPIEWKIQQFGFYALKEYPVILGCDGAGVVQKVGREVTNLSQGDRITFQGQLRNTHGTYQEYCLTDAITAIRIPPNVSFERAASIATGFYPFAIATYAQQPEGLGLTPPFEEGGLGKYVQKPIVIFGGASSVGQYAIQLAKLSGFSPLITTASLHNKDFLTSLGATHVLDRTLSSAALREQVEQITVNTPVTYIFDAVSSKETQEVAFDLLAPGGTLIVTTRPQVAAGDGEGNKKISAVFGTPHVPQNRVLGANISVALTKWLAEEVIKPNRVEVLPGGLNGVAPGLKRLATNGVSGTKLVVRPVETVPDV